MCFASRRVPAAAPPPAQILDTTAASEAEVNSLRARRGRASLYRTQGGKRGDLTRPPVRQMLLGGG